MIAPPFYDLVINGAHWPRSRVVVSDYSSGSEAHGTQHRLVNGSAALQFNRRPGSTPVNSVAEDISVTLAPASDRDGAEIERALRARQPLDIMLGDYIVDTWRVSAAGTEWQTSRRLPLGIPVVPLDHIEGWIDGVAAEIITGAPGAGQIQIPTSNGAAYATITTAELSPGSVLELRYTPIRLCAVEISVSRQPNAYEISLDLIEATNR